MKKHLLLFLVLVGCLALQGQTPFGMTRISLPGATTLPTTCEANREVFIDTDATPTGQQLFLCNSAGNGFNLIGDGGGQTPGDWLEDTGSVRDFHPNPREFLFLHEEFIGGRTVFADALGGELGWSNTSGTTSRRVGERGRPGIAKFVTSATINNLIRMELLSAVNGEFGPVDLLEWRMHWGIRASQLTQIKIRMGFLNPVSGNPPADGIYFENISTTGAANWFGVSRAASTETNTDTSTLLDTSFHDFEIRNDGSNNITFFIDGTQVGGTITTNIPTANMVIVLQVENTEAVAKDINIDYWTFWMAVSR